MWLPHYRLDLSPAAREQIANAIRLDRFVFAKNAKQSPFAQYSYLSGQLLSRSSPPSRAIQHTWTPCRPARRQRLSCRLRRARRRGAPSRMRAGAAHPRELSIACSSEEESLGLFPSCSHIEAGHGWARGRSQSRCLDRGGESRRIGSRKCSWRCSGRWGQRLPALFGRAGTTPRLEQQRCVVGAQR